MKARTKSTKSNITLEVKKSFRKQDQNRRPSRAPQTKKSDQESVRRSLTAAMRLLEVKMQKKHTQRMLTLPELADQVHRLVEKCVAPKNSESFVIRPSDIKATASNSQQHYSSLRLINEPEEHHNSLLANKLQEQTTCDTTNPLQPRKRSNSALDNYFRDKFSSPAKDEQTVERRLRALKALKKTQQMVARNSSKSYIQAGVHPQSAQVIGDRNIMIEKLKYRPNAGSFNVSLKQ